MSRFFNLVVLLFVLVGFVPTVQADAMDAWVECIAAKGYSDKVAKECGRKVKPQYEAEQKAKVLSMPPVGPSMDAEWHYRHPGGDSFKNALLVAVRKAKTQSEKESIVDRMVRDSLNVIGLSPVGQEEIFPLVHNQARKLVGLSSDETLDQQWDEGVRTGEINLAVHESGQHYESVAFGNALVRMNAVADWGDQTVPAYELTLKTGEQIAWLTECWNLTSLRSRAPPPSIVPGEKPPSREISIYKEVNEKRAIVEVNGGVWAGAYSGDTYKGWWYGGQAWVYVPVERFLGTEEQISAGVGVYAAADGGHSKVSDYRHRSSRVIGLLGIKGNGFNEDFDPHWWSVSVGAGPDWMKGKNSDSGYWMKQKTWLLRFYTDYLTQRGDWILGAYGEGFWDVGGGWKKSSWSGFPGEGRSSARFGVFGEYRFHPHFSVRIGGAGVFQQSDGTKSRFFVEPSIGLCYRDSWDEGDGFAIGCLTGGASFGQGVTTFIGANIFVGEVFNEYVKSERAKGVTLKRIGDGDHIAPLPITSLEYPMEPEEEKVESTEFGPTFESQQQSLPETEEPEVTQQNVRPHISRIGPTY